MSNIPPMPPTPKPKKPTNCVVCDADLPDDKDQEVSPTMYYVVRYTCSNECHNKNLIDSNPVDKGWMPLVRALDKKLTKLIPGYEVLQVKEKFGGLRYYIEIPNYEYPRDEKLYDKVYDLIGEYEKVSFETCMICGEKGTTDTWGRYWVLALCEKHGKMRRDGENIFNG